MNDREIGVEEARKRLGPLVDDAALEGTVTYLTRRGRRYAAIVPLDRIKEPIVNTCENCRSPFNPDKSTALDPERFCKSECETQHVGE